MKGGYAWADTSDTLTFAGAPVAFTFDHNHKDGWTVGGGVEYMFAQSWSAKLEYQYYNFGNSAFVAPAPPAVRFVPQRRTHREGRHQLSHQLGRPGGREVLIFGRN